jgi:hypothetical protein
MTAAITHPRAPVPPAPLAMTGNDWLRWHARRRWLAKMRADGPVAAPVGSLKARFAQDRCDEIEARLGTQRAEAQAAVARQRQEDGHG